jgi:hypothetical protein
MKKLDKKICTQILILLLIPVFPVSSGSTAALYVDPSSVVTSIGDTFSVNITISDVADLGGWEFKLYYSSFNLNGTELQEGPFLKQGGDTYFAIINFTDNYNSTHGIVWATCALLGSAAEVSGNGTLAIISFKGVQLGSSDLSLTDTWLSDSEPIPHEALNGTVHVLPHDLAVTDLTLFKTVVGQGLTLNMTVHISNQGDFAETFNVTIYANTTSITTQTCTLASRSSTILTYAWNTTDFTKGNYAIKAYAWPVQFETDTENNTFENDTLTIAHPGDVDADKDVDIYDVVKITAIYGSKVGDPEYNPNADIDGDGKILIYDVVICTSNYGHKDP